ncbi:hypothetical protein DCC39_02015 [Pueribacillus theae]|uniref:N-Dimethylarginine dimethylaminohydrolase n=1 Tax=Pueribacillus theae TaxID=2171751 RepID=A0A2U1K7P5_9BACI|nr:dimethylarginine dimethylaminohydrolase family protein [Pueribacillus theae]PWA13244.1 hypothetical protein DCC39_02015 [Pueribacillus theae]
MSRENGLNQAYCMDEYSTLKKVILCPAHHMEIREVINHTQEHFAKEDIDKSLAAEQHKHFTDALESYGIEVVLLPADKKFPEQVFTRDIGFTLGNTVFLGNMRREIRQGEEKILEEQLAKHHIPFQSLQKGSIEGGDVIIDRNKLWIGVSTRTSKEAIDELQKQLPHLEVTAVPFLDDYLHLDCVFNIVSPDEAVIFPKALDKKMVDALAAHYDLIEVTEEEQFTLGTNLLSIGNRTLFSLPMNKNINKKLKERGFNVIEVDISEIIKSGGSFRCVTLPLVRG